MTENAVGLLREVAPSPMNPGPAVMVDVRALRSAGSPRSAGEDLDHVRTLAETQAELPPVIVHRATMAVIDGLHRLRAAKLRGQRQIAVRFFEGDEADAFVLAVRANVAHGLPLTAADRKAAAVRIVSTHPQWSDRLIASATGLSARTIADLRRQSAGAAPQPVARIGRDGRVRPVDGLARRRLAGSMLREDPQLSLRQVAAAVGISPETVRAVRTQLMSGADPRPPTRPAAADPAAAPAGTRRQSQEGSAGRERRERSLAPSVRRLRADPSLRFSERGRTLLRLLDAHCVSNEKWAALAGAVPPHRRDAVATAARECAHVWRRFAEQVEHIDQTERTEQPDQTAQPDQPAQTARPERAEQTERARRMDQGASARTGESEASGAMDTPTDRAAGTTDRPALVSRRW
ncbi:ParB/RepB/Spo0J family partition protein [Streptomyces sp. NPDC051907]|uniref:ParB/RepB/Spo0J family partition protein n=1 Tax=Streptomyces sp. NPDC051907 TaxID=3155284 RepID=UPI0034419D0F